MSLNTVIERLSQKEDYLRANWTLHPNDAMFLYLLVSIGQFEQLLEVGTSIGFSTLHLAQSAQQNRGHVTSIDASAERQQQAKVHLEEAGLAQQATLIEGNALTVLKSLIAEQKQFDFMFLDARKSEYIDYFHCAEKLLQPGGLLVADNTRSHREEMLDFIQTIQDSPSWESAELSTPSGLLISRRK